MMAAIAAKARTHDPWCRWHEGERCKCGSLGRRASEARAHRASDATQDPPSSRHEERPLYRTLGELKANPELLLAPEAVIPYLAFSQRVTMFAGTEKIGKTTYCAHAAAAKTKGAHWLGEPTLPGLVLWVTYEGHVGDVVRTMIEAGADDDLLVVAEKPPERLSDIQKIAHHLEPAVIIVDTLTSAVQGLIKDPYNAAEWTPIMNRFGDIAGEENAAVVLIHHARKSDGQYRDSTAVGAGVDMILTMMRADAAQPTYRKVSALGRFPLRDYTVRFDDTMFVLADAMDVGPELKVLRFLRENPRSSKNAIRQAIGGKHGDVDAAMLKLLREHLVVDEGDENRHRYSVSNADAGPRLGQGSGQGGLPLVSHCETKAGQSSASSLIACMPPVRPSSGSARTGCTSLTPRAPSRRNSGRSSEQRKASCSNTWPRTPASGAGSSPTPLRESFATGADVIRRVALCERCTMPDDSRVTRADRVVHHIEKRDDERVCFSVSDFKGQSYVSIRIHFRGDDGEWHATKKGITVHIDELAGIEAGVAALRRTVDALPSKRPGRLEKYPRSRSNARRTNTTER
jgi:hypothetical protein